MKEKIQRFFRPLAFIPNPLAFPENSTKFFGFIHRLAALAGCFYLRLVGFTTSIKFYGAPLPPPAGTLPPPQGANEPADVGQAPPFFRTGQRAGQVIYVIWHCQQAFLIYAHRGRGITALASKSGDGEYAAQMLERFNYVLVRGSTSSGGLRSLIQLIQCARDGQTLAITPDGPKGPARKVQKGAVYLARKTGLPIIAIAGALSNKILTRSWDRFQIPLPFGRAVVAYSAPFYLPQAAGLEESAAELEKVLNETGLKAEELLEKG
ncbi:MAG: lysophospholipid acyltransferase family protein [Elusimicrobia bacterium]|nr:lysophospholipid acyltransferase family protein [Elusimicrobiota bacterium]